MGKLYIVATPIGNLQDITLRAMETLQKVDAIVCEDTRRTSQLLHHIASCSEREGDIKNIPLISYYEQNELQRIPEVINALKNGLDVALVSDAGTPAISDPGFKLIRECLKEGVKVESIPGPCSVISALVSSGLPTDKFMFLGYPPKKPGHRRQFFEKVLQSSQPLRTTMILFEAPHKLIRTLEEMNDIFGNIEVVIARELTKVHEEFRRETISQTLNFFEKQQPKGEFVILLHL